MNLNDLADFSRTVIALLEKQLEQTEEAEGLDDQKAALEFHTSALEAKRLAADIGRIAEDLLVAALDGKSGKTTIDGTTVEIRRAYKRTWDSPLLAGAVAACVLQGERLDEVDEVVAAFIKTARLEWRVTALEEIGIETDRYCSKDLGRASVTLL